ncbi:LysR family transcriptional regulator [Oceanicoccus sagamiensis]|uniref:HTH lysR-type domain-containing protein n=1 Tax=Oceanicoccus sagamiensis TaxID=716816 RepID=A0A1X9N631_9GAMM|nr:LysR family transcriptional regulator [Oceanicoccus sagamiensis]ARN72731.1 hypothetical protein BST96_00530 [Oceanicoccus sagamiensis]
MNIRKLDLNLLVVFDAVMRERSVSKAAQTLSLTQPAVSNALGRLREMLDDPLLVRTRQGMEPTTRALEISAPVQQALMELDQCLLKPASFDPASSKQSFVIAATDYVAQLLMPRLLRLLEREAPGVKVRIKNFGSENPEAALESGEFDFAMGRFFDISSRLKQKLWLEEQLCCLVRKAHPQIKQRITLKQYLALGHVWVSSNERRGMVDRWLEEQGRQRTIVSVMPNYSTAAMVVAQTDLALVLPQRFAADFCHLLPVKVLPLPMRLGAFKVDILWHPRHGSTPGHQWMLEQLSNITSQI